MRLRYKPWAKDLIATHQDIALNEECLNSPLPSFTRLEIGSGQGGFLIQKAYKEPEVKFLGVEINYTAFAISIKKMVNFEQENNYKFNNLIFINARAEKLFDLIQPESLDAIYLNFNDPWIKKKQNKRRLTFPTRLEAYYKLLKKGGYIYFKTDNDVYYEDSKKYFDTFGKYACLFEDDYTPGENDVISEYEAKFRAKGQPIHRITAKKGE